MNYHKPYIRNKKSISRLITFNLGLLLMMLALFSSVVSVQAQSSVSKVSIAHVEAKPQPSGLIDISAFVSVTNEAGQPVTGLTAGDFILTENDQLIKPQSLSVTPANNSLMTILLIDDSAGMAEVGPDRVRIIDTAKDASIRFIDALTDGDMIEVYAYDQQVRTLQKTTHDHNYAIDRGVSQLDASESEQACLYDALYEVGQVMTQKSQDDQLALVVITGSSREAANSCGNSTADDLLKLETTTGNPIPIFSVSIGDAVDQENLATLSKRTGGQSFVASDAASLKNFVSVISRQLKNHYEINYTTELSDVLAKISVVERSSQQSASRNVIIPQAIDPTPTPQPQFSIGLTVEQVGSDKLVVNADVPSDVTLNQSQLFVNNNLIQRTLTPPFGQFEIGLYELGSGQHNIRVRATDINGVEASAEVDLTLTLPPTPVPTVAPASQPETDPAPVVTAGDEANVTDSLPIGALAFVVAGILVLVVGSGLIGLHLFFRSKRAVPQPEPMQPVLSPVSYNVLDSLPNNGQHTLLEENVFDQPSGDHTFIEENEFDTPDPNRTFIEDDNLAIDPELTFIREENPVKPKAKLVVTYGEFLVSQPKFELSKPETTIGRNTTSGNANDIAIADRETSRAHAKIIYRQESYFIQDLNSSTGTKVNGVKLKAFEDIELVNGAEIAIGPNVKFKFDFAIAPAPDETIFEIDESITGDNQNDGRTIFEITEEERT